MPASSGPREFGYTELLPVGLRGHAGDALEQAAEEGVALVAHLPADLLDGCGGTLQAALGVLDPQALDVLDRSQPGGGSEAPLERALGEPGAADDFIDGAGDREMRAQPFLGMPDLRIVVVGPALEADVGREAVLVPL